MRSVILLGMLVPVLGLAAVSAGEVEDQLDRRDASRDLQAAAQELRAAVGVRAAFAEEEIHATVVGLAHDFGMDVGALRQVGGEEVVRHLADARDEVDRARRRDAVAASPASLAALDRLRSRVDRGQVGQAEVVATFARVNADLRAGWARQLERIEQVADRQPLEGDIRARLRALGQAVIAFEHGGPQVNAALQILLREPTLDATAQLVRASARYDAAAAEGRPNAGPRTAAAWRSLATDPAAVRTADLLEVAATVPPGSPAPWASPPPEALASGIEDGERWGSLLVAVPEAGAAGLAAAAGARAETHAGAVLDAVLRAGVLILLSVLVALALAKRLTRPTDDLERAARLVEQGDFDLPPLPVRGPREVRATVAAFNDMAATLAAVQDHAVALAEDPSSPVLDHPLPGRTGLALQAAIDRLRRSVGDAELHRAELFQLATHDGLTGLLNRAAAYAEIERELSRALRDGQSLLAVYVDLDGLKELNDTHGHQAGDEAIVRTADALLRDADTALYRAKQEGRGRYEVARPSDIVVLPAPR